jgi:epoxyqueuosine reductase QueG
MPQLVIESGLGEASRMGIALNPFVGASFKVSAVLTDLPLETDRPIDFGLQDYCTNCKICAEQCPTQAITYGEKEIYNGYETWPLNYRNCVSGIATNNIGNICQRCTKICPWNRPDNRPEDLLDWDGSIELLHASVNRQAERMQQNGYREPEEYTDKWWFPLVEDEKGNLTEGSEFDYKTLDNKIEHLSPLCRKNEKNK